MICNNPVGDKLSLTTLCWWCENDETIKSQAVTHSLTHMWQFYVGDIFWMFQRLERDLFSCRQISAYIRATYQSFSDIRISYFRNLEQIFSRFSILNRQRYRCHTYAANDVSIEVKQKLNCLRNSWALGPKEEKP